MSLQRLPKLQWEQVFADLQRAIPEAFLSGQVLNLVDGRWQYPGTPRHYVSAIGEQFLGSLPMIDLGTADGAVVAAANQQPAWGQLTYTQRAERVGRVLTTMKAHRDLFVRLLIWEIGKPVRLAEADFDRAVEGVQWYVEHAEAMAHGRAPVGLVSNIASWNYPLSVLAHAILVQMLVGNATIAKTPTDGGLYAITLAAALMHREGLPVSLVSGPGGTLSEALVRHARIDAMAFVGGKSSGRAIAASLMDRSKRYMLEMEGINAYGVWNFSDWNALREQVAKGYEYGKQRCTAYVRWVVQRDLFPRFLDTYKAAVTGLRVGDPTLGLPGSDRPQELHFGPLINAKKVRELDQMVKQAESVGAVRVHQGQLDPANFLPDDPRDAYVAPRALFNVGRNADLYHAEPFGPVDTFVVVDREEELVQEMNVSNGALVATLGTDDHDVANRLKRELHSFKVGHNKLRSRGDREEAFGGIGQSWRGCFVGGEHLVRAVTTGDVAGNFDNVASLPPDR